MSLTEIIVALIGLAGSVIVAYLAYQRGAKADNDARESAAAARVLSGYDALMKSLQEANTRLEARLATAYVRMDRLEVEIAELKASAEMKQNK